MSHTAYGSTSTMFSIALQQAIAALSPLDYPHTHTSGLVVTFILLHSTVKSLHGALVSMASCYKACCIMASPSNKACHLVALMCMYLESSSLPALTFSPCG